MSGRWNRKTLPLQHASLFGPLLLPPLLPLVTCARTDTCSRACTHVVQRKSIVEQERDDALAALQRLQADKDELRVETLRLSPPQRHAEDAAVKGVATAVSAAGDEGRSKEAGVAGAMAGAGAAAATAGAREGSGAGTSRKVSDGGGFTHDGEEDTNDTSGGKGAGGRAPCGHADCISRAALKEHIQPYKEELKTVRSPHSLP